MFKNILDSIILTESLKSAKEFVEKNNIPQEIFDKFNALDSTPTKKLIHQLLKWYMENVDLEPNDDLKNEIDIFIKFSGGRIREPIEKFKTYTEFKEFITPFLEIETKADKKDALAGQYKKVFENENMLVLITFTHKASCIYGAKTKWCTTEKQAQYFNNYQSKGYSIFYVINKKDTDENNPFHKMAVQVDAGDDIVHCYDTMDNTTYEVNIQKWIQANGIPNLKTVFKSMFGDSSMINAIKSNYKTVKKITLGKNNAETNGIDMPEAIDSIMKSNFKTIKLNFDAVYVDYWERNNPEFSVETIKEKLQNALSQRPINKKPSIKKKENDIDKTTN